jgi:hypothetical protein
MPMGIRHRKFLILAISALPDQLNLKGHFCEITIGHGNGT